MRSSKARAKARAVQRPNSKASGVQKRAPRPEEFKSASKEFKPASEEFKPAHKGLRSSIERIKAI